MHQAQEAAAVAAVQPEDLQIYRAHMTAVHVMPAMLQVLAQQRALAVQEITMLPAPQTRLAHIAQHV